jgi:hypothetical protein
MYREAGFIGVSAAPQKPSEKKCLFAFEAKGLKV